MKTTKLNKRQWKEYHNYLITEHNDSHRVSTLTPGQAEELMRTGRLKLNPQHYVLNYQKFITK